MVEMILLNSSYRNKIDIFINIIQAERPILEPKDIIAIGISQIGLPAECNVLVCVDLHTSANRVLVCFTSMNIAKSPLCLSSLRIKL